MGKRITDLPEGTLEAGDYIVADREDGATKKVPLHDTLSAYVTGDGLETALEPYATEASLEQLTRTASGTVATATTAYAGAALRSVAVKGRSVQDGTPTPDAPVAVESVEDLTVAVSGKNLFRGAWQESSTIVHFYPWKEGNTSYGYLPAGTYTVSYPPIASSLVFWKYRGGSNTKAATSGGVATITLDTAGEVSIWVYRTEANGGMNLADVTWCQLEVGSAATPYQPYVGTSAPLDLDGHALRSLPDGTCDEAVWTAEGGTLTQRMGSVTFDGSETWARESTYGRYHRGVDADQADTGHPTAMCSHFKLLEQGGSTSTEGFNIATNSRIYFNTSASHPEIDTVEKWKAWLASNPVTVIYKLAEPLTHALPTSPLPDAPAADMAVWADCEPSTEVDVEYRESIQLALDEIREAIASIV